MAQPKGWPQQLRYLTRLEWSPDCPKDLVKLYTGQAAASADELLKSISKAPVVSAPGRPSKLVKICPVTDTTHPAFGQRRLCAASCIHPGAHILDYLGVVHPETSASTTSDYIIGLGHGLSIDAESAGNEARFVNDFRGVAPRPNAEFDLCFRKDSGAVLMGVWAVQKTSKGEEILVSYGKGFWNARASGT